MHCCKFSGVQRDIYFFPTFTNDYISIKKVTALVGVDRVLTRYLAQNPFVPLHVLHQYILIDMG